jgi:ABC-type dipeptide/oligopeptide/nickel transport system ATPase component
MLPVPLLSSVKRSKPVDDVTLAINEGEIICLVGESGCGKTISCLSIFKIVTETSAYYFGTNIIRRQRYRYYERKRGKEYPGPWPV